jgi:hypothetical protein
MTKWRKFVNFHRIKPIVADLPIEIVANESLT